MHDTLEALVGPFQGEAAWVATVCTVMASDRLASWAYRSMSRTWEWKRQTFTWGTLAFVTAFAILEWHWEMIATVGLLMLVRFTSIAAQAARMYREAGPQSMRPISLMALFVALVGMFLLVSVRLTHVMDEADVDELAAILRQVSACAFAVFGSVSALSELIMRRQSGIQRV